MKNEKGGLILKSELKLKNQKVLLERFVMNFSSVSIMLNILRLQ